MSLDISAFYQLLNSNLISSLQDELTIYNKLYDENLSIPTDLQTSLYTIIKMECNEIKLIKKVDPELISLKNFISSSDDITILQVILKILIIIYRLKNKLNIILGVYGIDYEIYLSKDKEDWISFMEDRFDFKNINIVYLNIINPVRFHYKNIIYQLTANSDYKYFFKTNDNDIFYILNFFLLNLPKNKLQTYINEKRFFGEDYYLAIKNYNDISSVLINKNKDVKFIKDLFLDLYTFDKTIQTKIFSNNQLDIKYLSKKMSKDKLLEELYKNSTENNFNFIDVYNNLPLNIFYDKFNLQNLENNYKIKEIIDICESAIIILTNYRRYLQLTEIKDILTYKTIMRQYNNFNNLYYRTLSILWDQIYYILFNYSSLEFVNEYYFKNLLENKCRQIDFVYNFLEKVIIQVNNNYKPTFTLQQLKSLYKFDSKNIISFLVKKMFHIRESDRNYENKSNIIETAIKSYSNDVDTFYSLIGNIEESKSEFEGRGEVRIKELSSLFNSKEFNKLDKKTIAYLDFGAGDGEIAAAIAKHISSKKEFSYALDIEQWFGNIYESKYADYVTYGTITRYEIPFMDNYLEFITCFQVLHHIKKYDKIISELYRVLKPGGILLIREHDCRDDNDRMLIDVEHSIYETTLKKSDKNGMYNYLSEYEAYYKSRSEWDSLLKNQGFINMTSSINYKLSEPKGQARYYYDIYTK